jgi:hypothetical protein
MTIRTTSPLSDGNDKSDLAYSTEHNFLPFIALINSSTKTYTLFMCAHWALFNGYNGLPLKVQYIPEMTANKAKELYMVYHLMNYVLLFFLFTAFTLPFT